VVHELLGFEVVVDGRKNIVGGVGVALTDKELEARAGPREVVAHTPDGIGLDHSCDTGGFEGAFGEFGFGASAEGLNDDEVRMFHRS
jgi:hypothetical protein